MKKILSLVFVLVMVMSFSVTAFAQSSSSGVELENVYIANGSDVKVEKIVVNKDGGTVELTARSITATFNGWSFYVLKNGQYKEAVEGEDYTFVSGDKTATHAVVRPLKELYITGNYKGTVTDPKVVFAGGTSSETSPKTGDAFAGVILAMMAAVACAVVSKKQLAK